jgi:hypothetical protein
MTIEFLHPTGSSRAPSSWSPPTSRSAAALTQINRLGPKWALGGSCSRLSIGRSVACLNWPGSAAPDVCVVPSGGSLLVLVFLVQLPVMMVAPGMT